MHSDLDIPEKLQTVYPLRYQMSINSIQLKHWFVFWKWVISHLVTEYFTFHFKGEEIVHCKYYLLFKLFYW